MPAVIRAESSEQSAGVCFHGVHGQEQVTTDFPVGLSAADSAQDLQFSFGGWVGRDFGASAHGRVPSLSARTPTTGTPARPGRRGEVVRWMVWSSVGSFAAKRVPVG